MLVVDFRGRPTRDSCRKEVEDAYGVACPAKNLSELYEIAL
jgi:hypothetical protein